MKFKDIKTLGLYPKTLENLEFDVTGAVLSDCFNLPRAFRKENEDYRDLAIKRFIDQKLPFDSNCNISFEMAKRFVTIICPYCGKNMKYNNGGGNSCVNHISFKCECGAESTLELNHKTGLSFSPKSS